jgi:hypothetical protein
MQQRRADAHSTEPNATTLDAETVRTRSEQLHLRNYDESRRYRLTVSVSRPGTPVEHEATYELDPGDATSELEIAPPGRYEVRVSGTFRPAGRERADGTVGADGTTANCNVGDRPQQTVVVECGNGIVAVSEGLSG